MWFPYLLQFQDSVEGEAAGVGDSLGIFTLSYSASAGRSFPSCPRGAGEPLQVIPWVTAQPIDSRPHLERNSRQVLSLHPLLTLQAEHRWGQAGGHF